MTENQMHDTDPRALAELFGLSPEDGTGWVADELGQVLKHQLSALLADDLVTVDPGISSKIKTLNRDDRGSLTTFGDLLAHPHPPLEFLEAVKEFSKACRRDAEASLPVEIATFLYYASIAKALVAHGTRISKLPDESLREGLQWLQRRSWVDRENRALIRSALEVV